MCRFKEKTSVSLEQCPRTEKVCEKPWTENSMNVESHVGSVESRSFPPKSHKSLLYFTGDFCSVSTVVRDSPSSRCKQHEAMDHGWKEMILDWWHLLTFSGPIHHGPLTHSLPSSTCFYFRSPVPLGAGAELTTSQVQTQKHWEVKSGVRKVMRPRWELCFNSWAQSRDMKWLSTWYLTTQPTQHNFICVCVSVCWLNWFPWTFGGGGVGLDPRKNPFNRIPKMLISLSLTFQATCSLMCLNVIVSKQTHNYFPHVLHIQLKTCNVICACLFFSQTPISPREALIPSTAVKNQSFLVYSPTINNSCSPETQTRLCTVAIVTPPHHHHHHHHHPLPSLLLHCNKEKLEVEWLQAAVTAFVGVSAHRCTRGASFIWLNLVGVLWRIWEKKANNSSSTSSTAAAAPAAPAAAPVAPVAPAAPAAGPVLSCPVGCLVTDQAEVETR